MMISPWLWRALSLLLFLVGAGLVVVAWRIERVGNAPAPLRISLPTVGDSPIARAFGDRREEAGPALPAGNFFELPGQWRDAAGGVIALKDLRGRPAVVTFIYTSCQDTCPLTTAAIDRALDGLPPPLRDTVRAVALSIDPARDTPRALASYAATHKLDSNRWVLLSPRDEAALRAAAKLLNVSYFKQGGEFAHNDIAAAVDGSGRVRGRFSRPSSDPERLAARLREALTH